MMTAPESLTFENFIAMLRPIAMPESTGNDTELLIRTVVVTLEQMPTISRSELASVIRAHPSWFPVLGLIVGLSREQLKNHLRFTVGSSAWLTAAKRNPERLIEVLDTAELRLVDQLRAQVQAKYTLADVLIARAGTQERAGRAVGRGRVLENLVEEILRLLKLSYEVRTRFVGTRGEDAPCDFAVPAAREAAKIVVAVKGFDSTGSKLSAAVDEIDLMARKRRPDQFVFVVIDGIGWLSRQADLRRIFDQLKEKRIDGLYSLASLASFEGDLFAAARRVGLL